MSEISEAEAKEFAWHDEPDPIDMMDEDELRSEFRRVLWLYHSLLYAVSKKYPNESRHETALRYIREAEVVEIETAQENSNDQDNDEIC